MSAEPTPQQIAHSSDSRQGSIVAALIVILVLGNSSVAVRFLSQFKQHRRLFAEDYLIAIAVICLDVVIALLFVAVHYGFGLHVYRVVGTDPHPPANLVSMFKFIWITSVLNGPCFLSVKLSLLFFYRRIFLVNQRWLRLFWFVNLVYAVLWFIGSTLDFIFQCIPVNFYWERSYLAYPNPPPSVHGKCDAAANWQVAMPIIFSVISDFALLGLPVASLLGLKMSRTHKIALIAIFSVGLIACFLEVSRVIIILVSTDVHSDPSYNTVAFLILSSAGEGAAIICACLPFIAAHLRYLFERIGNNWHSRASSTPKPSRFSRLNGHPIPLSARRNGEANDHEIRDGYSSQEQLQTGTSTTIGASSERDSGVVGENGIRVKMDLEWVAGRKP